MKNNGRIYRNSMVVFMLAVMVTGCGFPKTDWKVTQYADESGGQANFYTLSSNRGDLIVVDGGTEENADYVKSVIEEKGGEVDAWILTHPHPDHIGAFVQLYQDPEIRIEKVYDNGVALTEYEAVDQEWDEIAIFKEYLTITDGAGNVESVNEGEELLFDALSVKFYNGYQKGMASEIKDMPNNSSLVFKAESEDKSILFTGDCYEETLSQKMLQKYGDELHVDYVQMAHHGNNTLPIDFYKNTGATVAFFDAPEWLIQGQNYDTLQNMRAMEELGMTIYDYTSCPNEIDL